MTASPSRIRYREDPRLEAAQKRLRESASQADALEAVREIVTNLLGCEEIGLFTVDQSNSLLFWSFGIDPERHKTLDIFGEPAIHRVLRGEFQIVRAAKEGDSSFTTQPLRVFVPIRVDGRTVAVLVMLKLLPQKLGFDEADIKLVKLLSEESGRVLFERSANANV